jgi:uncharacterized protein (DUF1015 family)
MEIKAFKALRFNEQVVGNAGDCICPPYDVIDEQLLDRLYAKNDYNAVRLIRNKPTAQDNETNNPYTRAAFLLNEWISKGALKENGTDAVYAYVQDFELGRRKFRREAFIALGKLEELGNHIRDHENTLIGPRTDRLNLQRATAAQFGLIFMLYEDPQKIADKIVGKTAQQKPLIEFVDEDNVEHRLFAISDKNDIEAIRSMMDDKNCVIADGHHRYASSLSYYKQTGNPRAAHQVMAFVNTLHDGMIILATHRLVYGLKDFSIKGLLEGLRANFDITEYKFDSETTKQQAKEKTLKRMKKESAKHRNAYGIYTGDGVFSVAVLKDKSVMDKALPHKSSTYRLLDVAVLHKLILEDLLEIGEKQLDEKTNLEYVKDTPNAVSDTIERVDAEQIQAAFFTNPEKMKMIQQVADAGEKMPQKSTFFFPKVYSGMTIYKM